MLAFSSIPGLEVKKCIFLFSPPLTRCVIFCILSHQLSMFWLFQILLVLHSLSTNLFLQHSFFPNHLLFSYLLFLFLSLLSHFLNYHTSQASQLPWGLIILPPFISYGQKTRQDYTSGPNPNLYCLYFRMKHIFCVMQTGTLSRMNNVLSLGEGEAPITFLYFQWPLGKGTALTNSQRGSPSPDEELF